MWGRRALLDSVWFVTAVLSGAGCQSGGGGGTSGGDGTDPPAGAAALRCYVGQVNVPNTSIPLQAALSDRAGSIRLRLDEDGNLRRYEGILPGLNNQGSTQAIVDIDAGTVSGAVTTPDGESLDLTSVVMVGLTAIDSSTGNGFTLRTIQSSIDDQYTVHLESSAASSAATTSLSDEITFSRRTTVNGESAVSWENPGTVSTQLETSGSCQNPAPLPAPPPPIELDAGGDQTIASGGQIALRPEVRGGVGELLYAWSPAGSLSDPYVRQPLASPLATTVYTLTISDEAAQSVSASTTVIVTDGPVPPPAGEEPNPPVLGAGNVIVTSANTATIRGGVEPDVDYVEYAAAGQMYQPADLVNDEFVVDVDLELNRINEVFFVATRNFVRSAPVAARITQDSETPFIFIEFPQAEAPLSSESIPVTGRVGDMLSGAFGLSITVTASVAGTEVYSAEACVNVGSGNNGTFAAREVPLAPNSITTITATVIDEVGLSAQSSVDVVAIAPTGLSMKAERGNDQTAGIRTLLGDPLEILVADATGSPLAGQNVTFEVASSDGTLSEQGTFAGSRRLTTATDEEGIAP